MSQLLWNCQAFEWPASEKQKTWMKLILSREIFFVVWNFLCKFSQIFFHSALHIVRNQSIFYLLVDEWDSEKIQTAEKEERWEEARDKN